MGKRRNSLIILGLVVVLLAASIYVIASKPTVLGLDLRGGTELVYQGRPTPQVPDVTPEDIDRAIEIIRERVDSLGVSEPEISRVGQDADRGRAAERLQRRAGGRVGRDHRAALPLRLRAQRDPAGRRGSPTPRTARTTASTTRSRPPPSSPRSRSSSASSRAAPRAATPTTSSTRTRSSPIGDPSEVKEDLFANSPNEKQPPGTKVLAVPRGTVVLEDKPDDDPSTAGHRRVGRRLAVLRPARQARPHRRPDHRPEARDRPVQPADGRLQLHRRGPRGVRQRHLRHRPARVGRLLRRDRPAAGGGQRQRRRPVLGLVRDRPRRRADLAADHQLRRQPERDRRAHRARRSPGSPPRRPRTSPRC